MIESLLKLPIAEREKICEELRMSIIREKRGDRDRTLNLRKDRLMDYAAAAMWLPRIEDDQCRQNVLGRRLVIYELLLEGLNSETIGKLFHCNHSTIIYSKQQMENVLALPAMYDYDVSCWKRFQNIINNETHR